MAFVQTTITSGHFFSTPSHVLRFLYLGQVLFDDIIPHLGGIKLRVESRSDHWHDVVDAAQARLFSQQIP